MKNKEKYGGPKNVVARFATRETVERAGGRFVEDLVVGIDPARCRLCLRSGPALAYDLLSCNCGSQVSTEGLAGAATLSRVVGRSRG